jgi:hypothetical protein
LGIGLRAFYKPVRLFLNVALGVKLFEVGPQVVNLIVVLDPGERHFSARNFSPWILDVFLE